MYPDTGEEEETDDDSESIIVSSLRQWLDTGDSLTKIPQLPDNLSLSIKLHINKSGCQAQSILINVSLPLGHYLTEEENTRGDKRNHLPIICPQDDDLVSALEHIIALVQEAAALTTAYLRNSTIIKSTITTVGPLIRIWVLLLLPLYLQPSKMQHYAPSYGLSGFLLAGKPGILCLEGVAQDIDDYMNFIKTESWGDIPSGHKKVSERRREEKTTGDERRRMVFDGMEEIITDSIEKKKRGAKGNMQAVEIWLGKKGWKDAIRWGRC